MRDLCAAFQQSVVEVVADRLRAGLKIFRKQHGKPTALVCAGGVAANEAIRKVLQQVAFEAGTVLVAPPPELCTDNGAMIAWAGAERLALGLTDTLGGAAARALAAGRGDQAGERAAGHIRRDHPRHHRDRPAEDRSGEGPLTHNLPYTSSDGSIENHMAFDRIAVVGAGAWGCALANVIARAGRPVLLAARDRAGADHIVSRRESPRLPGLRLDERIGIAPLERRGRALRRHPAGGAVAASARSRAVRSRPSSRPARR